jgi:hypothetical protein
MLQAEEFILETRGLTKEFAGFVGTHLPEI